MIYICHHCREEIPELQTPGTDHNYDFICPDCSKKVDNLLKSARAIQLALTTHFKRLL